MSLRLVHEAAPAPAPGRSSRGHCGWSGFGRFVRFVSTVSIGGYDRRR